MSKYTNVKKNKNSGLSLFKDKLNSSEMSRMIVILFCILLRNFYLRCNYYFLLYRWILINFKREFSMSEIVSLWEVS